MNVCCIVVRYNSEVDSFRTRVLAMANSIDVFVYDNSKESIEIEGSHVFYFHNPNNDGLATGLNYCVNWALSLDYTHGVYFDQDSDFDTSLVNDLTASYLNVKDKFNNLFVLGPQPVNKNGKHYPVRLGSQLFNNVHTASEIITSGMVFMLSDVVDLGFFDESLFLDLVDFDLCWRANERGMLCVVDANIKMLHAVGEDLVNVPFRPLPISSPIRNYYQIRNILYVLLYKQKRNFLVVMYYFSRKLINITINLLFADKKLMRLKYNYLGFRDAIKGRMGKLIE